MGEEQELELDKKAVISVLTDVRDMLRNDESFESIVKQWANKNSNVPDIEKALREAYANTIDLAIKHFQSFS